MGLINNDISEDRLLLLLVNLRSPALCATTRLIAESFPLPRAVPPRTHRVRILPRTTPSLHSQSQSCHPREQHFTQAGLIAD